MDAASLDSTPPIRRPFAGTLAIIASVYSLLAAISILCNSGGTGERLVLIHAAAAYIAFIPVVLWSERCATRSSDQARDGILLWQDVWLLLTASAFLWIGSTSEDLLVAAPVVLSLLLNPWVLRTQLERRPLLQVLPVVLILNPLGCLLAVLCLAGTKSLTESVSLGVLFTPCWCAELVADIWKMRRVTFSL